jgi:hypothetical protein
VAVAVELEVSKVVLWLFEDCRCPSVFDQHYIQTSPGKRGCYSFDFDCAKASQVLSNLHVVMVATETSRVGANLKGDGIL